ncbi:hypothetical protein HDU67_008639 [Dinochytrium kinnereticum]|nr:hypothetical protein HDU67_008639 [Dinochytrium kinnereticum]
MSSFTLPRMRLLFRQSSISSISRTIATTVQTRSSTSFIQTPIVSVFPARRTSSRRYTAQSEGGTTTDGEKRIFEILTEKIAPERLMVKDISGGCGAMYAVQIASSKFEGISLVKQHQMVVKAITAEIKNAHGSKLTYVVTSF